MVAERQGLLLLHVFRKLVVLCICHNLKKCAINNISTCIVYSDDCHREITGKKQYRMLSLRLEITSYLLPTTIEASKKVYNVIYISFRDFNKKDFSENF